MIERMSISDEERMRRGMHAAHDYRLAAQPLIRMMADIIGLSGYRMYIDSNGVSETERVFTAEQQEQLTECRRLLAELADGIARSYGIELNPR